MSNQSDFAGRAAIVTGAARGMGRQIAEGLLARRAQVLFVDSDEAAVTEVAASNRERAAPFTADIADRAEVAAAVQECLRSFGRLDVMVCHAGIGGVTPFLEIGDEEWDRLVAVNFTGTFYCMQEAARVMAGAGGGAIVVTASTNAFWVEAETAHYSATKGALITLVKGAAFELASRDIRVNAIAPSVVRTPSAAFIAESPGVEAYVSRVPMGRLAEPEDVVGAVCFLASDDAAYVTGHTLVIDGGVTLGVDLSDPGDQTSGDPARS
jgi:glucose 1-dehydrogenase